MLGNFEHEARAVIGGFERVQDLREMILELHVHDGADDLRDASDISHVRRPSGAWSLPHSASAPEMISISSFVIIALAGAVVGQSLLLDHVTRVAGRVVHRAHAGALFGTRRSRAAP